MVLVLAISFQRPFFWDSRVEKSRWGQYRRMRWMHKQYEKNFVSLRSTHSAQNLRIPNNLGFFEIFRVSTISINFILSLWVKASLAIRIWLIK